MNLQPNHRMNGGLRESGISGTTRTWGGALVFLEITIATVSVVGLFDAACQPFGWQGLLQFVLFAGLGALLWVADATLNMDESFFAEYPQEDSSHQASTDHIDAPRARR